MLECQLLRRPHRASRENGKRTCELHHKSEKQVLLLELGQGPVGTAYCERASEAVENTRYEVNKYVHTGCTVNTHHSLVYRVDHY